MDTWELFVFDNTNPSEVIGEAHEASLDDLLKKHIPAAVAMWSDKPLRIVLEKSDGS